MRQLEKQKVKLEPWTSAMEETSRRICHPGISRAWWNPGWQWIWKNMFSLGVKHSYCMHCQSQPSLTYFNWRHMPHLGLLICLLFGWLVHWVVDTFVFFTCYYVLHILSYCWTNSWSVFKRLVTCLPDSSARRIPEPISWFLLHSHSSHSFRTASNVLQHSPHISGQPSSRV